MGLSIPGELSLHTITAIHEIESISPIEYTQWAQNEQWVCGSKNNLFAYPCIHLENNILDMDIAHLPEDGSDGLNNNPSSIVYFALEVV